MDNNLLKSKWIRIQPSAELRTRLQTLPGFQEEKKPMKLKLIAALTGLASLSAASVVIVTLTAAPTLSIAQQLALATEATNSSEVVYIKTHIVMSKPTGEIDEKRETWRKNGIVYHKSPDQWSFIDGDVIHLVNHHLKVYVKELYDYGNPTPNYQDYSKPTSFIPSYISKIEQKKDVDWKGRKVDQYFAQHIYEYKEGNKKFPNTTYYEVYVDKTLGKVVYYRYFEPSWSREFRYSYGAEMPPTPNLQAPEGYEVYDEVENLAKLKALIYEQPADSNQTHVRALVVGLNGIAGLVFTSPTHYSNCSSLMNFQIEELQKPTPMSYVIAPRREGYVFLGQPTVKNGVPSSQAPFLNVPGKPLVISTSFFRPDGDLKIFKKSDWPNPATVSIPFSKNTSNEIKFTKTVSTTNIIYSYDTVGLLRRLPIEWPDTKPFLDKKP